MSKCLSSTLGSVYPNMYENGAWAPGFAALRDNPGFFHNPPYEVGNITVGADTYSIAQHRYAGSNEIIVKKNGTQVAAPLVGFEFTLVGFAAYVYNDVVHVFYISTPDEETINDAGQILPHVSGSYTFHSVELCTATWSEVETDNWEDTPSIDPNDPGNMEPHGGEYADTMRFGALDDISLSEIELPYAQDYGKLVMAYVLDAVDMSNLGEALFLGGTWQNLKNKFEGLADPMNFIFSCKELALDPSYISKANRYFSLGGNIVHYENNNPVVLPATLSRFTKVTLGSFDLKEVFGTSKDYTDVDISIYLPYCGVKQLDPDIVVGTKVTLVVMVDCWTGDVFYTIHTNNSNIGGKYYRQEAVVYRFTGNCATNMPIGKVDNSDAVMKIASNIVGLGVGAAMAGATGGASVAGGSMTATNVIGLNTATGNAQGLAQNLQQGFNPTVQTSDGVSGAFGLCDLQFPYLIIKRGVPQYPDNFRKQIGAPRYQTLQLNTLSGFTKFSAIHLEYMGIATVEEINELERLLTTEGVIL